MLFRALSVDKQIKIQQKLFKFSNYFLKLFIRVLLFKKKKCSKVYM